MKKKASVRLNKAPSKINYHQEIIVKPAERLFKALIEAEEKERKPTPKVYKTAIHR